VDKRNVKASGISVDRSTSIKGGPATSKRLRDTKINSPDRDADHKVSDIYDMIHPNGRHAHGSVVLSAARQGKVSSSSLPSEHRTQLDEILG